MHTLWQRERERERFYIHVPSPVWLIGWNISIWLFGATCSKQTSIDTIVILSVQKSIYNIALQVSHYWANSVADEVHAIFLPHIFATEIHYGDLFYSAHTLKSF